MKSRGAGREGQLDICFNKRSRVRELIVAMATMDTSTTTSATMKMMKIIAGVWKQQRRFACRPGKVKLKTTSYPHSMIVLCVLYATPLITMRAQMPTLVGVRRRDGGRRQT